MTISMASLVTRSIIGYVNESCSFIRVVLVNQLGDLLDVLVNNLDLV